MTTELHKPRHWKIRRYIGLWSELLKMCFRSQPLVSTSALFFRTLAVPLFAAISLSWRAAIDGAQDGVLRAAVLGAVGAAVAYSADTVVSVVGFNLRLNAVERVGMTELDIALARDIVQIETLDHLERPDFLDRVAVLRGAAWGLMDSAWAAVESALNVLRLGICLVLLGTVSPWLLGLLAFAAAPLWFDARGRKLIQDAETASAPQLRLQKHLFELATRAASGKELRISGSGPKIARIQAEAWEAAYEVRFRARVGAAVWQAAGWAVFIVGFALGLGLLVYRVAHGHGSVGDLVLTVTMAVNLRTAVNQTVSRSTQTAGYGRLIEPYLWLRGYADRERSRQKGNASAPEKLAGGIRLRNLTFSYPEAERPAVDDVSIDLPAGAVVAVVGEYGSGKSTLVKLLCRFYRPQAGAILVDGVDLAEFDAQSWWSKCASAFQDFGRYKSSFREAVGLGDPPHMDDASQVEAACASADAQSLIARLPEGLETRLGREHGGVELSEGQWQKTALARACMRRSPVLFVLDEPTASLDAPSEHAIFERYISRARDLGHDNGAITLVVSHRFSTIAGADLILVMDEGRLVEAGTHQELTRQRGRYAELFAITSRAYADQDAG